MKKIYSPFTIPLVPYCNNTHVLYDILADIAKGFAIKCFILETILCKNIFRIFAVCIFISLCKPQCTFMKPSNKQKIAPR